MDWGKVEELLIEKGLMCAVFMNQLTVNYLGDIANDNNTVLVEGENYTKMENIVKK